MTRTASTSPARSRRALLHAALALPAPVLLAACGKAPTAAPAARAPAAAPTATGISAAPSSAPAAAPQAASPAAGAQAGAQAALPACIVRPQQTEGPYFVDEKLNRVDIRSDPADGSVRDGVPLRLVFRVAQVAGAGCAPLAGAVVDVWQCDALGVYSDVRDPGFTTTGKQFLRGYQVTDANGVAQFTTIYPGWYAGRAVHIHFKIRTAAGAGAGAAREFTSQLYFDDALTDRVHGQAPYASKRGRRLKNDADGIYRAGGGQLLLNATPDGQGYAATFDIGLQLA